MEDEQILEQFKKEFIKGYIDASLDRLLDLRNGVNKAKTTSEVRTLMYAEQRYCRSYYGIKEDTTSKEGETPTSAPQNPK